MTTSRFAIRGRVFEKEPESHAPPASQRRGYARQVLWWVAALLAVYAFWQFSGAGYVHAKAAVAQQLIAWSWKDSLEGHGTKRPWPWADTRPVARMTVPSQGIELFVLAGTTGRSLAFGPGHVSGTAAPGAAGNSVIVAHRDTHFAFLRYIGTDAQIDIETAKGVTVRYRVREAVVVNQDDTRLLDPADSAQLTLITCYPFDAVRPGTSLRYVVIADRIA